MSGRHCSKVGSTRFSSQTLLGRRVTAESADTVQERVVEGLEKLGIVVLAIYEGGPEPLRTIGSASSGKWKTSADLTG